MNDNPETPSKWLGIADVLGYVAAPVIPVVVGLLMIAALPANEHRSIPDHVDQTVTGSMR